MSSNDAKIAVLPMFFDAYSKAHWAANCAQNLNSQLTWYIKNGVRITVKEADSGKDVREVFMEADPLMPIGLAVGDIIRNLRGALDAAVSAVYRRHDLSENQAYWPFGDSRTNLEASMRGNLIKVGLEKLSGFFLDEIQCTKAGNFPLWSLNQIDRTNKHRTITIVVTLAVISNPSFYAFDGRYVSIGNRTVLKPGQNCKFFIPANAVFESSADAKPTISVTFGPSEVFSGSDVIPTIKDLTHLVIEALKKFQISYVGAYLSMVHFTTLS